MTTLTKKGGRKGEEGITWDVFAQGLWRDNPVLVMLLGLCPVLAVSNSAVNALAMGLATTFVLVSSGALVSLLRHLIPWRWEASARSSAPDRCSASISSARDSSRGW